MTVAAGDALSADYVIGSFEGTTIGARNWVERLE